LGNPPEWVADKLLNTLERLPGPFGWADAREVMLEEGVNKEEVDAMLHALVRVPGMDKEVRDGTYPQGVAVYRRPANYQRNVRHRAWRITPRRLNLADAEKLAGILHKDGSLTPGLETLREQMEAAIRGLE
jgi:hypothetical protein